MSGSFAIDDVGIEVVEKCLVCTSSDHFEILKAHDTLHGLPGLWCVRKCRACGHGFTSPRPDRDSISLYYPDDYSPFSAPVAPPRNSTVIRWLKSISRPLLDPRRS